MKTGTRLQKPLSERERRFVEAYMSTGNGLHAAKAAGYKGSNASLAVTAARALRRANVQAALTLRAKGDPAVATRKERQLFWTAVMFAHEGYELTPMRDRLKASELLGKSHADFIEMSMPVDPAKLTDDQLKRIINGEDPLTVIASPVGGGPRA